MIIYFSATGNSKAVAAQLAGEEDVLSVTDCFRDGRFSFADESIGVISPTYFWGLPSIVEAFLEKATFRTDYLYFVATYGTTPGAAGALADAAIHGREIDAYYSVRTVEIWTPVFDLSAPEKVAKYTKNTGAEIDAVRQSIRARRTNRHMRPRTPVILTKLFAGPIYHGRARRTANLHVEESCIGCGLCAAKCPVQAIEMREKKPVWVKEKCVMCLGCLHRCPKFAIQYKNRTKKHGQYQNPNEKV